MASPTVQLTYQFTSCQGEQPDVGNALSMLFGIYFLGVIYLLGHSSGQPHQERTWVTGNRVNLRPRRRCWWSWWWWWWLWWWWWWWWWQYYAWIIIIIIIKLKLKISGWSSICGPRRSKGNWELARGSVYTTWHGGCSTIFCRGICFALLLTHLLLNIGILAQSMQVSPKSYFSLLQWCQSKHKLSCWSAHRTWDNGEVMLDERQDQKEKCRGE